MTMVQNRRNYLTTLPLAGAAGVGSVSPGYDKEPPPETTTIRLTDGPIPCTGPLYMAEELFHEEGFTEVSYVPAPVMMAGSLTFGYIDFALEDGFDYLPLMDRGSRRQYLPASIWDASNCGATTASIASLEDTIPFFALRLHEAGIIMSTPNNMFAGGTDWHLFNEHKWELNAIPPYSHRNKGDLPCPSP